MPIGKPLTPAQITKAYAAYLTTASYSEAARAVGLPESTIRMAIKRRLAESAGRRDLHATALAEGEMEARALMAKVREKVATALGTALEPRDLAAIAGVVHDNARVSSTLRINDAKLNGTLVERTDVTSAGQPLALYLPDER